MGGTISPTGMGKSEDIIEWAQLFLELSGASSSQGEGGKMKSKGEQSFIDQYSRKLMVQWACQTVESGQIGEAVWAVEEACLEHALSKGWLTKREPRRVTAKGFEVAASFLRR